MERATGTEVYGCGSPQTSDITLNIQTTTGGNFSISLNGKNTVDHLKKLVSKKLKVGKDRICLLHRERQLTDGTLEENGLLDGARVILLPSVETGLLSQRPENSVMQALESLNDTQVNDFLSGKSPLNLTMRLGDHMMLIQLQLSTLTSSASGRSLRTSTPTKTPAPSAARPKCEARETPSPQATPQKPSTSTESTEESDKPKRIHIIQKQDLEKIQNAFDLCKSMADEKYAEKSESSDDKEISMDTTNGLLSDTSNTSLDNEQSPIKSLSNLVSSPIDASTSESRDAALVNTVTSNLIDLLSQSKLSSDVIPSTSAISDQSCPSTSSLTPDSSVSDDSDNFADQSSFLAESTIDEYPMENLFNSAIDKGLFEQQDESMMDREISNLATTSHGAQEATTGTLPSFQSINEPLKNKRFQYLLHKTSKFKHPIGQSKQKAFMQSVVNKHKKRMQIKQDSSQDQPSTSQTDPFITNSRKLILQPTGGQAVDNATPSTSKRNIILNPPNTEAWIEASKKLKEKLEKMAKEKAQAQPSTSRTGPAVANARRLILHSSVPPADNATPSTSKQQVVFRVPDAPKKPQRASPTPLVDTKALIEASKNLTQKLKKLSKEVLTNKIDLRGAEEAVRQKIGPGAVIESMKHHGKGIYSGTFSGTLNPALQDRYGRPKRDISTIIHILNDLLCASPPLTLAQKEQQQKHACAPAAEPCASCGQAPCALGQCDGHPAPPCACDDTCKKCDTAKTLALDNSKTKCKLEQLRLVMQQKKQRREARKLKTLPYPAAPPKTLPSQDQTTPLKEEIETLA